MTEENENKKEIIINFKNYQIDKLKNNEKIFLLKVLFSYYQEILITYRGDGLFYIPSGFDDLNHYFKLLRKKIIEIIESDETFNEIKNNDNKYSIISEIENIYDTQDFFSVWEEHTYPAIIYIKNIIDNKDLFENSLNSYTIDKNVTKLLDKISKELDDVKEVFKEIDKDFRKKLSFLETHSKEKQKEEKETTIKHEHSHKFENSIQEKPLDINIIKETILKNKKTQEPNDYQKIKKIDRNFNGLAYWTDGSITFNNKELILRAQLRDLLRLFISSPNKIMTYDDIKDTIIRAEDRERTKNTTISKYINELKEELKKYTTDIVIKNEKETGYRITKT
ncbi:MAG: winged helix-turn-helix domain-containing protein [Candidatus Nomurabacteria bacterium]